ncbi:MAG TPA: hypothetical protein VH308_04645 [Terracidiphilus sp.]|jgi:hypothetical protein|nr:hypothetical protein [Terracidiphilus sp.]
MKELLSDEKLTTADLVNHPHPATDEPEPAISEAATSSPSDRVEAARSPQAVAVTSQAAQPNPLFPQDELQSFRSRWDKVQTSFVDEPRTAVEQADSLVANVVKRIAEQFASEREQLEKQWDRGENVNTEDLRQALKRYRAFFDRLLAF